MLRPKNNDYNHLNLSRVMAILFTKIQLGCSMGHPFFVAKVSSFIYVTVGESLTRLAWEMKKNGAML